EPPSPSPSVPWDRWETHLPKAFFLLWFVPYLSSQALRSADRSASHSCAAFFVSSACAASYWSCSCRLALAFCDTHLPNAFFLLAFVPYLSRNAAIESAVSPR